MLRILAIDPSAMKTAGWAYLKLDWEKGHDLPLHLRGARTHEEWAWGAWEVDGMNFQMRCNDLKNSIEQDIPEGFDVLILEWPMFYEGAKGAIAAQRGYTINLAGIAMYIAGWFRVNFRNVVLYTAPSWKGTVKKHVTASRFYELFDIKLRNVDHNAIDATMMLVHHCKQQALLHNYESH